MAQVTSSQVKALREKSGAGMMDCKKALVATDGDIDRAVDWLRKKGLAAAAKRAARQAAEGLVGLALAPGRGALVEVNAETDFVARNERFQIFVRVAAGLALDAGGVMERLVAAPYPGAAHDLGEETTRLIAAVGENIRLRRTAALGVENGLVAGYTHAQAAPNLGRIGVLIAIESPADPAALATLGKQLAMHVAAAQPQFLSVAEVDAASLARERGVLEDQARTSGKPDEIIAKMVEGRLRKYYEEVVLLEQVFVIDTERRVREAIADTAADVGAPVRVSGFVRFVLGEGVERQGDDFAAEVAKLAG